MLKNLSQLGGRCPENNNQGFLQKCGQCWMDSLLMVLIYGGPTSDQVIENILSYNNGDINRLVVEKENMIPLNIDKKNMEEFKTLTNDFALYLRDRLKETLKNNPATMEEQNMSLDYAAKAKELFFDLVYGKTQKKNEFIASNRPRKMSCVQSIGCNVSVLRLYNINLAQEKQMDISGGYFMSFYLMLLFNFLYMNEQRFFMMDHFSNNNVPKQLINESIGAIISITYEDGGRHQMSVFSCNNGRNIQGWYYNNNGINNSESVLFEAPFWKDYIGLDKTWLNNYYLVVKERPDEHIIKVIKQPPINAVEYIYLNTLGPEQTYLAKTTSFLKIPAYEIWNSNKVDIISKSISSYNIKMFLINERGINDQNIINNIIEEVKKIDIRNKLMVSKIIDRFILTSQSNLASAAHSLKYLTLLNKN